MFSNMKLLLLKNVGQKTLCVIIVIQEEYGKTSCNLANLNGISHHPYFIYSHSDVSHVINIKV